MDDLIGAHTSTTCDSRVVVIATDKDQDDNCSDNTLNRKTYFSRVKPYI